MAREVVLQTLTFLLSLQSEFCGHASFDNLCLETISLGRHITTIRGEYRTRGTAARDVAGSNASRGQYWTSHPFTLLVFQGTSRHWDLGIDHNGVHRFRES
jgi:hypothetical protein